MKKIISILICILNFYIFAEEVQYKVLNTVLCKDYNTDKMFQLEEGTIISCNINNNLEFYMSYFMNPEDKKSNINCIYKNYDFFINTEDIELLNNQHIFNSNNNSFLFIPDYYFEYLKNKDFSYILNKERYWKERKKIWDSGKLSYYEKTFYDEYKLSYFYMNNLLLEFGEQWNSYIIKQVSKINNTYKLEIFRSNTFREFCYYPDEYLKYASQNNLTIYFQFDGDYVDVWLQSKDNYMGKYYAITVDTYKEIKKLVTTGTFNYSKIYFPRHSDGSSEYDKKIISPIVNLYINNKGNNNPSTNVSANKTMSVSENLKLRSGEATTSSVVTVMSAGTKVKILELGKAEKIDGIESNWVKVEVQKGAKDRDGKTIKAGTVGWCYGGYLK